MTQRVQNIYLVPTKELAQNLPFVPESSRESAGTAHIMPHCCIETEYGDWALEGTIYTANHHLPKYAGMPAPCNVELPYRYHLTLPMGVNIIVSHIDLDTVLGVMGLMGEWYFVPKKFREVAEFIDLNGPHHIHKFDQETQDLFNAYWAWNALPENRAPRATEITDVTGVIFKYIQFFELLFDLYAHNSPPLIEAGREWAANIQRETESKLLMETENYRVFSTDGVFCGASYYSPTHRTIAKVCISFNEKFKAITVSCSDGSLDCRALVQSLWGPEAGGHKGIAGSPRGMSMGETELKRAVHTVKRAILKPKVYACMEYTGECYYDWQCYPLCPALKKCVEGVLEWGNIVTVDQVDWE